MVGFFQGLRYQMQQTKGTRKQTRKEKQRNHLTEGSCWMLFRAQENEKESSTGQQLPAVLIYLATVCCEAYSPRKSPFSKTPKSSPLRSIPNFLLGQ